MHNIRWKIASGFCIGMVIGSLFIKSVVNHVTFVILVILSVTLLVACLIGYSVSKFKFDKNQRILREEEKRRQLLHEEEEKQRREEEHKRKIQEFENFLRESNFTVTGLYDYGDGQTFYFDGENRQWVISEKKRVFDMKETGSVWTRSKKPSKYSIGEYILTVDIIDLEDPLVKIYCGSSKETMEKIRATINALRKTKKKE